MRLHLRPGSARVGEVHGSVKAARTKVNGWLSSGANNSYVRKAVVALAPQLCRIGTTEDLRESTGFVTFFDKAHRICYNFRV